MLLNDPYIADKFRHKKPPQDNYNEIIKLVKKERLEDVINKPSTKIQIPCTSTYKLLRNDILNTQLDDAQTMGAYIDADTNASKLDELIAVSKKQMQAEQLAEILANRDAMTAANQQEEKQQETAIDARALFHTPRRFREYAASEPGDTGTITVRPINKMQVRNADFEQLKIWATALNISYEPTTSKTELVRLLLAQTDDGRRT